MKTSKLFKYAIGFVLMALCVFAIEPSWGATVLPDGIMNFLYGGHGVNIMDIVTPTAAAQAVSETVTTTVVKTAAPNLLRPEISNTITKVRPDVFPLDTILRKIGRLGKCDSREYKFYSSAVRGVADTLTAQYTQADATSGELAVTNPHIWLADDTGFVPGTLDYTGGVEFRFKVCSVDVTNKKITIVPINGCGASGTGTGSFVPTIPSGAKITRIGNAKAEIDAQNTPYANMPTDTVNYVQTFMCQVEESLVESTHNKEVEYNINDFQTDAIYDMRRMGELTMLFGYPKQDVFDPIAMKAVDLMGGARHFITKTITYNHTVAGTNAKLNTMSKENFAGNNGGQTRILFAGNGLIEWLMNTPQVEKQLAADKTEIIAGIKFKVISTFFGDWLVRRHQGFDDVDGYTYNGLILDIDNVERRIAQATTTTELDLNKTGQRKVKAYRIDERWTIAFRNPATHAWIDDLA